jgi:hypothetical protein
VSESHFLLTACARPDDGRSCRRVSASVGPPVVGGRESMWLRTAAVKEERERRRSSRLAQSSRSRSGNPNRVEAYGVTTTLPRAWRPMRYVIAARVSASG